MLGRRRRVGTIGRAGMVGESSIVFPGKTMNVRVHDRRAVVRFVRARIETRLRQGQRKTCSGEEKTAPGDFPGRALWVRCRFRDSRTLARTGNSGVHGMIVTPIFC